MDGNVLRVLSRLSGSERDIADPKTKAFFGEDLRAFLKDFAAQKDHDPGALNQALMELGALVCLPNGAPKCGTCPWKDRCEAHLQGRTAEIPVKSPKKARKTVDKTVFIVRTGKGTALVKNSRKGLLSGLYGLPEVPGHLSKEDAETLFQGAGAEICPLPTKIHIFTHLEWHMKAFLAVLPESAELPPFLKDAAFVTEEEAERAFPVASAYRKWELFGDL